MEYTDKQKKIISAAERLFSTRGYDGTSVRDIADEAGINIAMISYYFGSKEKLMEALFEQRTTNIKLKVEILLQDDKRTPLEKVELLADEYIDKIIDKHNFFRIMTCEQVINKNAIIVDLIKDLKRKNTEEFGKLIKDGQQKNVFKKEVDLLLLMNTLVGSVTQMILTIDYYREYYNLQDLTEEEFQKVVKQKLRDHIKFLFKALLSYEA